MTHLHVFKIASIANLNVNVQWMKFAIFLQAVNREWYNFLAGLRVDDTQVDLMGGSDEASNERSSFVVPTGRALRNQKSRKACRSCEEDRKAGKSKVLRILRQRIGRKNQITVLLSPTRRRRGRRKGRLDSFWSTYESLAQFGTSLGSKSTSNCLRLCTSIQRALLVNIQMSALLSYHSGTPFPSFARIFISLYLFFFFLHYCENPATLFGGWGCRQYLQVKMSLRTDVSRRTRRRLLRAAHKVVKWYTQQLCH